MAQGQVMTVTRFSGEKKPLPMANLVADLSQMLETIHHDMYRK